MSERLSTRLYILFFCGLLVVNIYIYRQLLAPAMLTITVLDVGKGRAVLVKTPLGGTLLIDTGPDASVLRAIGETLPMWQKHIDAIILTSSSAKMSGGLLRVQNHYRVGNIIRIGNELTPYGTRITFQDVAFTISAPATFTVSSGTPVFRISSSTSLGTYVK